MMQEQTLNKEFSVYFDMLSESQKKSLLAMMKSFLEKVSIIQKESL
jgi:hypothetical protein